MKVTRAPGVTTGLAHVLKKGLGYVSRREKTKHYKTKSRKQKINTVNVGLGKLISICIFINRCINVFVCFYRHPPSSPPLPLEESEPLLSLEQAREEIEGVNFPWDSIS